MCLIVGAIFLLDRIESDLFFFYFILDGFSWHLKALFLVNVFG